MVVVLIGFGGGCSGLGFGGGCFFWVWVGGGWLREGSRETKIRERTKMKREDKYFFYFIFIYYVIV